MHKRSGKLKTVIIATASVIFISLIAWIYFNPTTAKNTSAHKLKKVFHYKMIKTTVLLYKGGEIKHSWYQAAQRAHLSRDMYLTFTHIFSPHINFRTDLRPGDKFSLIYEAHYQGSKLRRNGPIVFAELITRGKIHRAIYYQYGRYGHYYLPDGRLTKLTYLRAPLKYKRISGYFTYHRLDPVLHIVRPHLGIDYAAKYDTPIYSIGEGKILFRGRRGGYGNAVVVQYSRKYKALYGHMAQFAPHLHAQQHIHKGQLLGYVGSTGWSTGPHLHFEFYVYGIPKNPLKIKLPHDQPIPRKYLHHFHEKMYNLIADLKFYQSVRFANNETRVINNE